jgi:hypothetical protein
MAVIAAKEKFKSAFAGFIGIGPPKHHVDDKIDHTKELEHNFMHQL